MDIQGLVKEFAENVAAQADAIGHGDANMGNELARRYIAAFERLREFGDEGREQLATLFFDQRPSVRVTAAAFLLRFRHAEAKAVLERESKGAGIIAFDAEQALERWKDGTWALDPV
jgi:hypothetical protein